MLRLRRYFSLKMGIKNFKTISETNERKKKKKKWNCSDWIKAVVVEYIYPSIHPSIEKAWADNDVHMHEQNTIVFSIHVIVIYSVTPTTVSAAIKAV